ncbi:DUF309 domain-containing protein [Peribacillus kribbensis]|uniref:DUF309 domain-containing protein n=1 Tax=Peribacillus kribbensis TaxID=356658 RepID=UPI000408A287|nr:DUF309 domain-containing protein [Peribacillus kribbensis]
MSYPPEYIQFLVEFHCTRDYFECHEILEEYWKNQPAKDRNPVWVAFIQLAVSQYHFRRDNRNGAIKSLRSAEKRFIQEKKQVTELGISHHLLLEMLNGLKESILNKGEYHSVNLPIQNSRLLLLCQEACRKKALQWGSPSDLSQDILVHKHRIRDRSVVIEERNRQLEKRRNQGDVKR